MRSVRAWVSVNRANGSVWDGMEDIVDDANRAAEAILSSAAAHECRELAMTEANNGTGHKLSPVGRVTDGTRHVSG
jgi:hypothetical protein